MNNREWVNFNPVRIIRAPIEVLPELTQAKSILLVTSPGSTRRGLVNRIENFFNYSDINVLDAIGPNPDISDLNKWTRLLTAKSFDLIIAVGGGSVIDAAKILSVTLADSNFRKLDDVFFIQAPSLISKRLPLMVVPTTAGTGSEVTPFATVWDHFKKKKFSLSSNIIFPDIALLDPTLILTLNTEQTLYTGLDAISHALESIWNKNKTPISEIYAIGSLRLIYHSFDDVLKNPDNLDARRKMQLGSVFAGLSISQTRTAIAHSISYPLTVHFNVPHGLACSFTLPTLIDYYLSANQPCPEQSILEEIKIMLIGFNLRAKMTEFLQGDEIINLIDEMYTPGRIDNYSGDLPDLRDFLSR